MQKDLTFDEILEADWEKQFLDGAGPSITIEGRAICTLDLDWNEYPSLSYLSDDDAFKTFNLFFYAKDMYKLLKSSNDSEMVALVEKILTDEKFPYK